MLKNKLSLSPATVLTPPYVIDYTINSVIIGNGHGFKIKVSDGTIIAKHYSDGFSLSVIFAVMFHFVVFPVMAFKNISFFNPYIVFLTAPISVLICFLLKKYQTIKKLTLSNHGKAWKGTFEGYSFEFQQCFVISSNLHKSESDIQYRTACGSATSQIYFIADNVVTFSFIFGTVPTNFVSAFKKEMSSDVYKGHFKGTYRKH